MRITANNKWLRASLVNQSNLASPFSSHWSETDLVSRVKKHENPKHREKEDALRKMFTEQVKNEEARFRQWEQQVKKSVVPGIRKRLTYMCLPSLFKSVIV